MISLETVFSGITERDRLAVVDEAESLARSLGDDDLLCYVLVWTAFTFFAPSRWDAWLACLREATRLADRFGDPVRQVAVRLWLGAGLFTHGRVHESNEVLDEMLVLARDVHPALSWIAEYQSLRSLVLRGEARASEK